MATAGFRSKRWRRGSAPRSIWRGPEAKKGNVDDSDDDENTAPDRPPVVEGAAGTPRQGEEPAPAHAVRRGCQAGRAPGGRSRRTLPRLLEESRHRRDADPPRQARPRVRARRADGSDAARRQDQLDREAG